MKKQNFYLNFLTYFYDIAGELDEYSLNELYRFGNNLYVFQSLVVLVCFLLALIGYPHLFVPIVLIASFIQEGLQEKFIKKLGLHKLEVEKAELPQAKKRMLKRTLVQTLLASIVVIVSLVVVWNIRDVNDAITFNEFLYQFSPIILAILIPLVFVIYYIRNRRRIVVVE